MSDMKCPFCGKEIIKLNEVMYGCVCDDTLDKYGTKELWQELITTRKALDLAVCALNRINCEMRKETMPDFAVFVDALKALEQIKEITKGRKDDVV